MADNETDKKTDITWREKAAALYRVGRFQPKFAAGVVLLSVVAAILEGFGLSFILPIIELAQGEADPETADGVLAVFVGVYAVLGVPFTMGFLVAGVIAVMTVRYVTSFLVAWFRAAIETRYVRHLQEEAFDNALDARIAYFDDEGSDEILNAIVTQAEYAGRVIRYSIEAIEQGLLAAMYIAIAVFIAPVLTVIIGVVFGGLTVLFRTVLTSGYAVGDHVADAKEEIQENAQAGTQGVRDVKLFGMTGELRHRFSNAASKFETYNIKLRRNESAITNFYQLSTAITIFVLIYIALVFADLTLGALGVFLFAMFRLGPKVSALNQKIYRIEGELPHLVRTQAFVDELREAHESTSGTDSVPEPVEKIGFDNVQFSYGDAERVLRGVSFSARRGEFVGFVGPSGAGKSTIVGLLTRMYEPDAGRITANERTIDRFDVDAWREKISVVRQDPYIFNDTLRRNVTIGNREASREEVLEVCEIAQVTEFMNSLSDGLETKLGDQGIKLSGGQRQRVAIARALLQDANVLILDEATSDLDTSIERRVHRAIEARDRDSIMIVIAHRLSTVANADRIYSMDGGRVVERGTHDELVNAGGLYADLYQGGT